MRKFMEKRGTRNFFWFAHPSEEQIVIFKKEAFAIDQKNFNRVDIETICPDEEEYAKPDDASKHKLLALESPHFFIVSMYLSSSEKGNAPQVRYLTKFLEALKQSNIYSQKTVILGGDINSYFKDIPQGY